MTRSDNLFSIGRDSIHTLALAGIDALQTIDGVGQDITSVVLNTKHKIAELFSKDLRRYHYICNTPVAVGVGLAGAVEAVTKPIVNGARNTGKTAVNLVSNALKSTLGNLFSTKGINFNTLKLKGSDIHIDTTKPARKRDNSWGKYRGILPKSTKIAKLNRRKQKLENKQAKIQSLIQKLQDAA